MLFELLIKGLCMPSKFVVNGIDADTNDFGEKHDRAPSDDYGCGDMQFTRIAPTKNVLEKYLLTEEEYSKICDDLESGLSFGSCGECI